MSFDTKELEKLFAPAHLKLKYKIEDKIKGLGNFHQYENLLNKIKWLKIYNDFETKYEKFYSSFELNKGLSALFNNKSILKWKIEDLLIDKILLQILTNKKIKNLNDQIIKQLDDLFKVFMFQHFIEVLDKESLKRMIELDKKKIENASKFIGKKIKDENLRLYSQILKKNDEYITIDGEGNYSKAARIVMKNSSNWRNKFKSFNTFKNRNKIYTYQDFENFLSTIRM